MADMTPSVDGVSPVAETSVGPAPATSPKAPTMTKFLIILGFAVPYAIFVFWCLILIGSYPSQGQSPSVIMIGVLSTILGALVLLGIGALGFFRVSASKALPNAKLMALIKLGAFVIPGFLLSLITAYSISREPALTISIISPTSADQFVAPLTVTFSAKSAVDALEKSGFKPVQYSWDINADKKADQQTLTPELTATFDKEGIYGISVVMKAADGSTRTATKRFIINTSVFSVTPMPAVIDRPTVFDLSGLYPKPEDVLSVAWDFDGDGTIDDATSGIRASFTYLATGSFTARAQVSLANKTQIQYARTFDVAEPAPLPFPVTIKAQPEKLIGTPGFAALFSVDTKEPVYSVDWNFGDGQQAQGERTTHTFSKKGSFAVVAKVRSQSGATAELSTVVKIVDQLDLNDLRFEGSNDVNNNTVTGEAPLTLDLTPLTDKQFVQFSWEAPKATQVGSTDTHLQAIFREPGTYTVTLVAQDSEEHVLRQPITVNVTSPSPVVSFTMTPDSGLSPLSVTFDASDSSIPGEDITGFIWNFGDGTPDQIAGAIVKHTFTAANTYTVSLSARTTTGVRQSATKTLIVRSPGMQARPFASRTTVSVGQKVEFKGDSSIGDITDWIWDFGDKIQNSGAIVEHGYVDPGTYTVTLTVKDKTGKSATSTIPITVTTQ